MKKRILVLASGGAKGGGSGAQEMMEYSRTEPFVLDADIVAFVSHHENGGVRKHADNLGVPFKYWRPERKFDADGYRSLVEEFEPDLVMCSGWLKQVFGCDPRKTVNIHPALLPGGGKHGKFGGPGNYGHFVHEKIIAAYRRGEVTQSGVTIHFVIEEYDAGPVIWRMPVLIRKDDTPDTLGGRVNQVERAWQSHVVNLLVNGLVKLDGEPGNWHVVADRSVQGFPGLVVDNWM